MAFKFKSGKGLRNVMEEDFLLKVNPFSAASIYDPANPGTYEPRMYGAQIKDFYKKLFLLPVMNKRQVIGAIWSSQVSNDWRGYGKSMLMAEESKLICRDFGATMLGQMEVDDETVAQNPMLAGYCSFNEAQGLKSFAAALLDAVAFILEQPFEDRTVHQELVHRICAAEGGDAANGDESEVVHEVLLKKVQSYGLSIHLSHKTLSTFMDLLCNTNTEALNAFIRTEIGPRIKANEGFNFVHIFNAFATLAGIVHVTFFIDQIENFAKFVVRNQDRHVKILRESMCQTSPTSQMASFVFQMHPAAMEAIENWWKAEHLPDLDFQKRINESRTINLRGLKTTQDAVTLAKKYLADQRVEGHRPPTPLHPFPEEVIEAVREDVKGNPRDFLRKLGEILNDAVSNDRKVIDLLFVEPLLREDFQNEAGEQDDDLDNPER
jgi:hypothetical protein